MLSGALMFGAVRAWVTLLFPSLYRTRELIADNIQYWVKNCIKEKTPSFNIFVHLNNLLIRFAQMSM